MMETDLSPGLAPLDPFGKCLIWTPEIERMLMQVRRWIRMDSPGGTIVGKQLIGKSHAAEYLRRSLDEILGYSVAVLFWNIPSNMRDEREFLQIGLQYLKADVFTHRDIEVLRFRLNNLITEFAQSLDSRRVVLILDNAQWLSKDVSTSVLYLCERLSYAQLRPFVLLIGQTSLRETITEWRQSEAHHISGRLSPKIHEFRGIHLSEFSSVLRALDKPASKGASPPAAAALPTLYATGWRLTDLTLVYQQAIERLCIAANMSHPPRVPMQFFRGMTTYLLNELIDGTLKAEDITSEVAAEAIRETGFHQCMNFYSRADDSEEESKGGDQ